MAKVFNVNGPCMPNLHYMVDLTRRLEAVRQMADAGKYFTINRARQYGKTTLLHALADYLSTSYVVISLDFQRMSFGDFTSEDAFVSGLAREINRKIRFAESIPDNVRKNLSSLASGPDKARRMAEIFDCFSDWCAQSEKPVILIIDEVDAATDNQVFLDFLAQLRSAYLDRTVIPTFQSVILAGVYDVRSIQTKIRPQDAHIENSPWNIAADFLVDMSFSADEIAGMLAEYEKDYHTGMDRKLIADLIYHYTSGYPYLVSRLCNLLDERVAGTEAYTDKTSAWTESGFLEAEKMIVKEDNSLYQSLIRKLKLSPQLREVIYRLLFNGSPIPYTATNDYIKDAAMFGFIRNEHDTAVISNRIFEAVLYNYFISEEFSSSDMYNAGVKEKNQFIIGGHLDIKRILEKFVETFDFLYGDKNEAFLEDVGRRYFLLFLKPIINGIGNYSIESQTRNSERMDLVIYYNGEQNIIELKIWRGNSYNERGEKQLSQYLDYYHLNKGYMLSFNFNKNKEIGVKEIQLGDKILIEAVV